MIGRTLGPYQIVEKLGAGGMGEVYRARDTRLNRDVAIKVLAPAFAQDRERMARFEREAQLLAQLNHANIGAIYEFENAVADPFLVLEYVPGETLRGPLPLEEIEAVARQLIDALEEAHEKTIVHRDLKPGNIKVTPEGRVKVLDFGLAKALVDDPVSELSANSPTLAAAALTRGAVLMGTAAYMSPEQARGRRADKRSDIWAFGCVLYEMLTGKQAFGGETISDSLAAILTKEPDWSLFPTDISANWRRLLDRCLEKDPKRRLRDIGEARFWLEPPPPAPATAPMEAPAPPPPPSKLRRAAPWTAGALGLAIAGVAIGVLSRAPAPAPRPVVRLSTPLPDRPDSRPAPPMYNATISPDGTQLAVRAGTPQQIYVRPLNEFDFKPLAGTENSTGHFFSPDGRWIGFVQFQGQGQGHRLKKIPVTGGAALTLCDVEGGMLAGASWGLDGAIVFGSSTLAKGLSRVPAAGGKPEVITKPAKDERHWAPQIVPGGQAVLFSVGRQGQPSDDARIAMLSLKTGEQRVLLEGAAQARYVPTNGPDSRDGHLVYYRAGSLFAVPFNLRTLQVTGSATPILEGVSGFPGVGGASAFADFSFSDAGVLVYPPGSARVRGVDRTLVWVDRQGKAEPIPAPPRFYLNPRLSPDGQRVATAIFGGNPGPDSPSDVWVYDLTRATSTRLTLEGRNAVPVWTPDGKRVTFTATNQGKTSLAWVPADRSGPIDLLAPVEAFDRPESWSPDGKLLLFQGRASATAPRGLWVLAADGDRKPKPYVQTQAFQYGAAFSPDGRWVAYVTAESGQAQVYVQPAPGPDGKPRGTGRWQISNDGGLDPLWSRSGRELFYRPGGAGGLGRPGGAVMAVEIASGGAPGTFRPGVPQKLFEGPYLAGWDVAADGKRFLMLKSAGADDSGAAERPQLHVVFEWFEEIRRRTRPGN